MVAWEVLRGVDERGAYANLLLPSLLAQRRLSGRDRGFATELAYGALRALGLLDGLLDTVTSRPVATVDAGVRDALRLGTYQLLRTRVPARAAVDTTVDLVRATSGERPVRFANAVLRRVADRVAETGGDVATLLSAPPFERDPFGHLAVVTSHPRWIVEALADALGGDLDETRAALVADDIRPAVHLVAEPDRMSREELLAEAAAAGLTAEPGRYSPFAVVLSGGDPGALPSLSTGRAGVQDEGSQLMALALARTPTLGEDCGVTVDLCAGPGGKAALLAALLTSGGAGESLGLPEPVLLACEPRASRAALVAGALDRRPAAFVVRADGRFPPLPAGRVDRVLIDAPCTGLGALRRRPEARWRKLASDASTLSRLQRQLLVSGLDLARPGGVVAYVTCSPHPAETTEVVDAVLEQRADVSLLDARASLPGLPALGDGPFVQLWPHRQGTDSMFLALLRRGFSGPSTLG
ncbi:transcription antitermination factor NusB [Pseudofrankia sp. BMG5.37]|uniref:RsmB/NOP family class I SAM-dependent RNA methyltransferase n=2 Tax=unclassified Pseudofrankia TaxID=2994372 RepID=UPI0008D92EC3|nr:MULTISPECIES: transcription antitermination factor NusB [unclassified Pseudofrankia]MDT3445502.1 transcription antitermination factor NusB [Pseudofrankia sp. BMG5.37]OHV71494.1 rRNA cytosine-C5-methyltransferase [Pseudofrankia sp. BMG5.36]